MNKLRKLKTKPKRKARPKKVPFKAPKESSQMLLKLVTNYELGKPFNLETYCDTAEQATVSFFYNAKLVKLAMFGNPKVNSKETH